MSARPVLGVICDTRVVGTQAAQLVFERYIRAAMVHADVAALLVPALPDLMQARRSRRPARRRIDDRQPVERRPRTLWRRARATARSTPPATQMAMALIEAMGDRGRPVFGICRGFQEINVAMGGTLRRDTSASDELIRHHAPDGGGFDAMFDARPCGRAGRRRNARGGLRQARAERQFGALSGGRRRSPPAWRSRPPRPTAWSRPFRRGSTARPCWRCNGIPNGTTPTPTARPISSSSAARCAAIRSTKE